MGLMPFIVTLSPLTKSVQPINIVSRPGKNPEWPHYVLGMRNYSETP